MIDWKDHIIFLGAWLILLAFLSYTEYELVSSESYIAAFVIGLLIGFIALCGIVAWRMSKL